jgi:hypothetical protein
MFGLLRKLGYHNDRDALESNALVPQLQPLPQIFAPGTRIPYDPALVLRLKQEHGILLQLFTEMMRHSKEQKLADAKNDLRQFESTYNSYILLEFTKLYVYLDCCLKTDPTSQAVVRGFRKKMNSVNRLVRAFVRRWRQELTAETSQSFLNHAQQIGQLLFARTKAEAENLYDIYDQCPNHALSQQGGI